MKYLALLCICFTGCWLQAQDGTSNYKTKKAATQKRIQIDTVAINNTYFELYDTNGGLINGSDYTVDFGRAMLTLSDKTLVTQDTVVIKYLKYPEFITRTYSAIDPNVIVATNTKLNALYTLQQPKKEEVTLFDGLNANGSISRGVTVGNNQNAVLNSQLDLQISGKLANDITLRASIKDDNIPIQESGYSQRVKEFDQIFIEMESKDWLVRAGDINLQSSETYFMNFTKKVQGIWVNANLNPNGDSKTEVFASGAVVRGRYTSTSFTGTEGNQGPYKLVGANGELYVIIVSGSERVYVNGILLTRGENNDYVIDYGSGEIIFTSRYPITSDMRIRIEYQYTDNNYTRYVTYGGVKQQSEKLTLNTYLYSESDSKNRPIQENLSEEQIAILKNAGDNTDLMTAPSASEATYDENRIQYTLENVNGVDVYVYSNNPEATLYNVTFTAVGTNEGNYTLSSTLATGKVYEYIAPVNGIPQGSYNPIVQLTAPTKTQLAVINGAYTPTDKTNIQFEGAVSNNDQNLFSDLDDGNNNGLAGKVSIQQTLLEGQNNVSAFANMDYIDADFKSIERVYNIEFNRDWNLVTTPVTNQKLIKTGLSWQQAQTGNAQYRLEYLEFKNYAHGIRHVGTAALTLHNLKLTTNSSYLKSSGTENESAFLRSYSTASYSFTRKWIGTRFNMEDNQQTDIATHELTSLSQRYKEAVFFTGIGDSLNLFAEVGYKYRVNDSIVEKRLKRFNTSQTYYMNSTLLRTQNTGLSAFISYRNFTYEETDSEDENSLNSRIMYNQTLWKGLAQMNTVYETNAGTIAQQEFSYVEVEAGQGTYTWNDYNNNGIQEIDEFEVAQFQDQAKYVRIFLPNQIYQKTHQTKFSHTLTLNPGIWASEHNGIKKLLGHFYNQASLLTDSKTERSGNHFNLNPFGNIDSDNLLGLNQSVRNTIFYNRGKQHYTTSYTYVSSKAKTLLAIGSQQSTVSSHQLQWQHRLNVLWLAEMALSTTNTGSASENYESRNYDVKAYAANPKLSYFFSVNSKLDVFYKYQQKENLMGEETLEQHNVGVAFNYADMQKISLNGEINYFKNVFEGNAYSAVGYQILEGLQTGNNFTWTLLLQKQLTKFLDLNLSYFGRKSETSKTIHTGSIQLKAYF